MASSSPFNLAIPVYNLEKCQKFYRDVLKCEEGRSSDHWVDFNFFGHQLVIHYKPKTEEEREKKTCQLQRNEEKKERTSRGKVERKKTWPGEWMVLSFIAS